MKTYNIMELLTVNSIPEYGFSFNVDADGKISDTGTEITIFDGSQFYNEVRAHYNHMLFDSISAKETNTEATNLSNARDEFLLIFSLWRKLNKFDYARAFLTMREQYAPLENYDRYEEGETITGRHKGTKTATGVDVTTTPTEKVRTTTKVNAYDGGEVNANTTDAETISGNTRTQGDASNNYTETRDISETVFDKDVESFNGRRTHGNIGVTSSMQLAEAEIDLRKKHLISGFISDFIKSYTYYVGGIDA